MSADAIPIVVRPSRGMRFPATSEDMRAVLARLPADLAHGLGRIELTRIGEPMYEYMEGVQAGDYLGMYKEDGCVIQIGGFVYDQVDPFTEWLLRCRMLTTLCHELAHHQDCTRRVGRREWRSYAESDMEAYAEGFERPWYIQGVHPVLYGA